MLMMLKAAPPVLVSVIVCGALVDNTFWEAKVKLEGEIEAVGPPVVPVPVSVTVCGLPLALSLTEIDAVRTPAAVGVKTALMVQFPPLATEEPQLLVWEKSPGSAPVIVMLEIVSVALPMLNKVIPLTGLLAPTASLGKVTLEVLKLTVGAVPVPVSEAVCGLPAALSLTETVACRVPDAVGVNVTLIVQLVPSASELPQLLV
jgi:hypothetical protein